MYITVTLLWCMPLLWYKIIYTLLEDFGHIAHPYCGLMSLHFWLLLEIIAIVSSGLKRKGTIQIVTSSKLKSQHLWWYGGVFLPIKLVACKSVKAPLMLKGAYRVWKNICCHPDDVFFKDAPLYFTRTQYACVTTVWLCSKCAGIDWPLWSPDLSPNENVWHIMQWRPQTVELIKSCIKQKWKAFCFQNYNNTHVVIYCQASFKRSFEILQNKKAKKMCIMWVSIDWFGVIKFHQKLVV